VLTINEKIKQSCFTAGPQYLAQKLIWDFQNSCKLILVSTKPFSDFDQTLTSFPPPPSLSTKFENVLCVTKVYTAIVSKIH